MPGSTREASYSVGCPDKGEPDQFNQSGIVDDAEERCHRQFQSTPAELPIRTRWNRGGYQTYRRKSHCLVLGEIGILHIKGE